MIDEVLNSVFEPVICDEATVESGEFSGVSIRGFFTETDNKANVGRVKVRSGYAEFAVKTKDVLNLKCEDILRVNRKRYQVHFIDDEVFGMTTITLIEVHEDE